MNILHIRPEEDLSDGRKIFFAAFTITLLVFMIYSNTFYSDWHFDDPKNIVKRHAISITSLTWDEIKGTFFREDGSLYRPLACLSLALNFYFGKDNVFGYHIVNIVIHVFSSFFLYLTIYYTLNLPVFKGKYMSTRYSIALIAAILWATNPIQTQAVTYIVQRMASMAGLFYILSIFLYLKARTTQRRPDQLPLFIGCAIAALAAIGCKENAFMIPVSLYVFELVLLRNPSTDKDEEKRRLKVWTVVLIISLGLCLLIFPFFRGGLEDILHKYTDRAFTLTERVLTQPRIVLFYLTLIFYPAPTRLSITHDISVSKTLLTPPSTLLAILVILIILLIGVYLYRRRPFVSFSVIFFFLNHLIESSFVPSELIFEHRNYTPSMFLFVPVAMLLSYGTNHRHLRKSIKGLIYLFIAFLIVGTGNGTFLRNSVWKTEETLWSDAAEKAPEHWRPFNNLAGYYYDHKQEEKALSLYKMALSKESKIDKDEMKTVFHNVGNIYQHRNEDDKAHSCYVQALNIDPDYYPSMNNLGVLLAQKGRAEEAIQTWEKAIEINPRYPGTYINLGYYYLKNNALDEAIRLLTEAIKIDPRNAMAFKGLAGAYRRKGLFGRAFLTYRKALAIQPKDLSCLLYLSEIYQVRGMNSKKEKAMDRLIRLTPPEDLEKTLDGLESGMNREGYLFIDQGTASTLIIEAFKRRADLLSQRIRSLEEMQENLDE